MTALSTEPDAAFLVKRMVGNDLAWLGLLLHPALCFVSRQGEPADRIIEVPVEVPSTEPFDPYELASVKLLRIVKARLWEDSRIDQAEQVQ